MKVKARPRNPAMNPIVILVVQTLNKYTRFDQSFSHIYHIYSHMVGVAEAVMAAVAQIVTMAGAAVATEAMAVKVARVTETTLVSVGDTINAVDTIEGEAHTETISGQCSNLL